MNKLIDNNIVLNKDAHKYSLLTQPDIQFVSVTTVIDEHFEAFDAKKIATNLVNNYPKYAGRTVESLISDWDEARQHGTNVHVEIEDWLKNGVAPLEAKATSALNWLKNYQEKSDIQLLPEVILYSTELKIAGTVDVLALDKITGLYELIDWKTSKRIDTVSYGNKMGISNITQDVADCNFYHYALQLSLYRYLLEEFYGISIHNQIIAHLQDDGARGYVAPYMRDHIVSMLKN